MPQISIINDEISDDIRDAVAFLKQHKISYLELRSFNRKNIANLSLFKLRRYAAYLRHSRVKVSAIASPLLKWVQPELKYRKRAGIENSHHFIYRGNSQEKIFKIADIFGAKYIRIFSFLKYPDFQMKDLAGPFQSLLGLAEKYNKILLIENEPICNIDNETTLVDCLTYFKHERLQGLFDLGNIYKNGGEIDYCQLGKIRDRIAYLHIKDYSAQNGNYVALGDGDVNYKHFLVWSKKYLPNLNFYSLETHLSEENRLAGTAKSVKYLKAVLKNNLVRYGIVGCGRVSKKHVQAIKDDPEAELVGVYDIDPDIAAKAAVAHGCECFDSLDKLISAVQVVNVCVPHDCHAAIISRALKRGRRCLCEKPGALTSQDADLIRRNGNYKKNLFVVFQNRYNSPIEELRKVINRKSLGEALYVFGSVRWFRPKDYYHRSWQGRKDREGGLLFNQGIHIIDIIMNLLATKDTPVVLNAFKDRLYHKAIETEDIFLAQFKLGKTLVNFETSVSCLPSNFGCQLFVVFDKGRAVVSGRSLEANLRIDFADQRQPIDYQFPPNNDVYGSSHGVLVKNLSKYVKTGERDRNLVSFDEAYLRLTLINKLYEAVKQKTDYS